MDNPCMDMFALNKRCADLWYSLEDKSEWQKKAAEEKKKFLLIKAVEEQKKFMLIKEASA